MLFVDDIPDDPDGLVKWLDQVTNAVLDKQSDVLTWRNVRR